MLSQLHAAAYVEIMLASIKQINYRYIIYRI